MGRGGGGRRHRRAGEIAGHGADRPVGQPFGRRGGRRRWRCFGGRHAAAAVGADHFVRRDRPATELDIVVVDGGRCPAGLGEYVHGFGEPAALVLVLEYRRGILASRHGQRGGANKRNPENDATAQKRSPLGGLSACPLIHI